jgi:hypothetical protein
MAINRKIKLSVPHKGGQRAIFEHPARFQVVACGRRFGKTELGKTLAYREMAVSAGEVWWIAPQYKMSTAVWRDVLNTFSPISKWVSAAERTIILKNDAKLVVWSGDAGGDTMRGGAPSLVILDEAAMLVDESLWYGVVLPALSDHTGRAYFLSTPRGRNWFHDVFQMGDDKSQYFNPSYKSWNFSSYNNPYMNPTVFDEARRTSPDKYFRQEYLAEFLTDSGEVFRGVIQVSVGSYQTPDEGRRYVAGIDWGRKEDFTVISIIDVESRRQVHMERLSKVDWVAQRDFLADMIEEWNPVIVGAEENSIGDVAISMLREEGINVTPYYTTNESKRQMIEQLALDIEKERIILLNEPIQVRELQAYRMDLTSTGKPRYNASSGEHDDTVIALAIANHYSHNLVNTFGGAMPVMQGWR